MCEGEKKKKKNQFTHRFNTVDLPLNFYNYNIVCGPQKRYSTLIRASFYIKAVDLSMQAREMESRNNRNKKEKRGKKCLNGIEHIYHKTKIRA